MNNKTTLLLIATSLIACCVTEVPQETTTTTEPTTTTTMTITTTTTTTTSTSTTESTTTTTTTTLPEKIKTCRDYCLRNGYEDGICRLNGFACLQLGGPNEKYEPLGDKYCPLGQADDACCCQHKIPEEKPENPYLDEEYCEKDSDCTLRVNCCNPCYRDYVNVYNKEPIPKENCTQLCKTDCPDISIYNKPICINSKCSPGPNK